MGETQRTGSSLEEVNEKARREKEQGKEKILQMFEEKEAIRNDDVEALLDVSHATAFRYLEELEQEEKIEQIGATGRSVHYKRKQ